MSLANLFHVALIIQQTRGTKEGKGKCFPFPMLQNVFFMSVKIPPEEAAFLFPRSQKKKCLANDKLTSLLQIFPANPPDFAEGPWVWRTKAVQTVLKVELGTDF